MQHRTGGRTRSEALLQTAEACIAMTHEASLATSRAELLKMTPWAATPPRILDRPMQGVTETLATNRTR